MAKNLDVVVNIINDKTGITGISFEETALQVKEGDSIKFDFKPSNPDNFNEDQVFFIKELKGLDNDEERISLKIPHSDFVKEKGKYGKYVVTNEDVNLYATTESDKGPIDTLILELN